MERNLVELIKAIMVILIGYVFCGLSKFLVGDLAVVIYLSIIYLVKALKKVNFKFIAGMIINKIESIMLFWRYKNE